MIIKCLNCEKAINLSPSVIKNGRKCCSHKCSKKYLWSNPEYREKMSLAHKGIMPANINFLIELSKTDLSRNKKREIGKIIGGWNKGKKMPQISGENHYNYKKDRSTIAKKQERNDTAYKEWRNKVVKRDSYRCKMTNIDCRGKIEVHHILSWRDYENLRYDINNGICLCKYHHPRKREDEISMSTYFKKLLTN
jgi:hypothetical protein